MPEPLDDICPRPQRLPPQPTQPLVTPIYAASVYRCENPDQADALLGGQSPGYVYSRDAQPNADLLAEKCRELHGAERATITSSGMSALALVLLAHAQSGDHVVLSNRLYGLSATLLVNEAGRLGITATVVDTCDLRATAAAIADNTRLVVVETITNPILRVSDLSALAKLAHVRGALLVVDNTFASPVVCRPLEFGADLVYESLTKIMNGHSDLVLGMVCGHARHWQRMSSVLSIYGLCASPWDCWLASRGLSTLHLRAGRANSNALAAAQFLASHKRVERVEYPGLRSHPDHALATRQFGERFGAMVAFTLPGGRDAATRFIAAARRLPFCPSLGELSTTLSHPESTSHRGLTLAQRETLGIAGGTIRLSVGTESPEFVVEALAEGLAGLQPESGKK